MTYYIAIVLIVVIIIINHFIKATNAYMNFYRAIHVIKDITSEMQYDIAAFGSTFAYYAFDLKEHNGHNFSIAPQGFTYMGKTVHHFIGNIREDGTAIIALSGCIFAANSFAPDERSLTYQSFLRPNEFVNYSWKRRLSYYIMRYVPFANVKLIRYLFNDAQLTYAIETGIAREDAIDQTYQRINGWQRNTAVKNVFDIAENEELSEIMSGSMAVLDNILTELIENNITPVLVILPVSSYFNEVCPQNFYDAVLYKCLYGLKHQNVRVLDYLKDTELSNPDLYWCADCLNTKGRKLFSDRIMNDIKMQSK